MSKYRNGLPQRAGGLFLNDAGLETDIIFNKGVEIREFAAHTLLPDPVGREALASYFREVLSLAKSMGAGFVLDCVTWKAHMHWADDLEATEAELRQANIDAVAFAAALREEFSENEQPIVLNALIGPRGDAYAPDLAIAAAEAEEYHSQQIGWLTDTEVDMVSALTFTMADEAIGAVRAARAAEIPVVVSFTVETDGRLPTGEALGDAIQRVDAATESATAYYMVNCAHPDHFSGVIGKDEWAERICGLRCNASRLSHAELDACEVLDDGDPVELAQQYAELKERMPWLNVFGGCCGTDLRHVTAIADALMK